MLLSMTGFGEARRQDERLAVAVEVRTVNNRHLKLTAKISDPFGVLEPEVDRLVRESIRRGSVSLLVRVDRPRQAGDYRLNPVALRSYRDQLAEILGHGPDPSALPGLLGLPGVVETRAPTSEDPHEDWPILKGVLVEALEKLHASRAEEGRAMTAELAALGEGIGRELETIVALGPGVVNAYRERLVERVRGFLESQGIGLEPRDLIREVAIFAERSDISEEITRLRAHLEQYAQVLREPESAGRKLEFVVQEMGRETNTIGSKAGDVAISRAVVEMKGSLEKIRELIQNVE